MFRRLWFVIPIFCLLSFGALSQAQAQARQDGDALDYVQRNLMSIQLHWSGISIKKGAMTSGVGFFSFGIERFFEESPAALNLAVTSRRLMVGGTIVWALGLAALVAELVIILVDFNLIRGNIAGLSPLFWGLMISGTAVSMLGGILMSASRIFLSRAVDVYNRDLFRRARSRKFSFHFKILPEGGAMAAVGMKF